MTLPTNRLAWRIVAVVVSVVVLSIAASRVDPTQLLQTLVTMRPGWFLCAVLLNGFLFLPAALRWHLVLGLMGDAVSYPATLRSVMAGHFFYVGLFGAVGGDSARSVYYARWFNRPLPSVLATAPLDRLLGFAGLLIFGMSGVALAVWYDRLRRMSFTSAVNPLIWLLIPLIAALFWWGARRAAKGSFARQLIESLSGGIRQLGKSPRRALAGIGCGILVQLSLSGILALNLEAVSSVDIVWARLVWTLPLISLLGGLPVTVAGLGTREVAAMALLGIYGLPGETAMAASLLCLLSTLSWAVCGGVVFWWTDRLAQKRELTRETP